MRVGMVAGAVGVLILGLLSVPAFASGMSRAEAIRMARAFEDANTHRTQAYLHVPLKIVFRWAQTELDGGILQYIRDGEAAGAYVEAAAVSDPRLTADGLLMALCHELGHLVREQVPVRFFHQRELLSDYFATSECFFGTLQAHPELTGMGERIPGDTPSPQLAARCSREFGASSDVCLRALRASYSVASFIRFARPDDPAPDWSRRARAASMFTQCTFESYLAGVFTDPMPRCFEREE